MEDAAHDHIYNPLAPVQNKWKILKPPFMIRNYHIFNKIGEILQY